jgi:hypothetical protein
MKTKHCRTFRQRKQPKLPSGVSRCVCFEALCRIKDSVIKAFAGAVYFSQCLLNSQNVPSRCVARYRHSRTKQS